MQVSCHYEYHCRGHARSAKMAKKILTNPWIWEICHGHYKIDNKFRPEIKRAYLIGFQPANTDNKIALVQIVGQLMSHAILNWSSSQLVCPNWYQSRVAMYHMTMARKCAHNELIHIHTVIYSVLQGNLLFLTRDCRYQHTLLTIWKCCYSWI